MRMPPFAGYGLNLNQYPCRKRLPLNDSFQSQVCEKEIQNLPPVLELRKYIPHQLSRFADEELVEIPAMS